MKRIGIIGGLSYESTTHYYQSINDRVQELVGGWTSAELMLRSVNFARYRKMMEDGDWNLIAGNLQEEALTLMKSGCVYVAVASNTIHKAVRPIYAASGGANFYRTIKLIHIGDCIAEGVKREVARFAPKPVGRHSAPEAVVAPRVLLLGTKSTMTENFLKDNLAKNGIEVMDTSNYPDEIAEIDRIIFHELCHGIVTAESKEFMLNFVYQFPADSQERPDAIVLGCTELDMILTPEDIDLPLVDSTEEHIRKIVELSLS